MTRNTKLRTVTALILLLAVAETQAAHYDITILADNHRVAHITATLTPDSPSFYMFPGANQLPARWSTFVSDFAVRDEDDQPVPVTANDDGTWLLGDTPSGNITFSYQVRLDELRDEPRSGVMRRVADVVATPGAWLLAPRDGDAYEVHFALPDGVEVSAK